MKMTIEIPEDVLSEVMALTGRRTKRDAVEHALRETARRAKQHRVWSAGLGLTPEALIADASSAADAGIDAPDIDQEAVAKALAASDRRRARRAELEGGAFSVNEDRPPLTP